MAREKKDKKVKKTDTEKQLNNILPQNIVLIGERVEEDKNIYISQKAYKEIHKFTQDKTTNESGGMLIGTVIKEFEKQNIIINGFIEAKHSEGTPTTLKFTHETWEYVHNEINKKYPNQKIVGWIHTHPDFGIFLSEYDKFIQENFFKGENQIAYVVDPIQNIEGFYFWINGKIERCKGFYVFDKNSIKITAKKESVDANNGGCKSKTIYRNILLGIMSIALIILLIMNFTLNNRLKTVEQQQKTLTDSANNSLLYMQQQIACLSDEIKALKELNSGNEDDNTDTTDESEVSDNLDENMKSQSDEKQDANESTYASKNDGQNVAKETTSAKKVKTNE